VDSEALRIVGVDLFLRQNSHRPRGFPTVCMRRGGGGGTDTHTAIFYVQKSGNEEASRWNTVAGAQNNNDGNGRYRSPLSI
jgi:hypothetical protein